MTRIVTGLERQGLVKRIGDPHDHRLTKIQATPKGQRVMAAGRARRVQLLTKTLSALDGDKLADLARGTQVFNEITAALRGK